MHKNGCFMLSMGFVLYFYLVVKQFFRHTYSDNVENVILPLSTCAWAERKGVS